MVKFCRGLQVSFLKIFTKWGLCRFAAEKGVKGKHWAWVGFWGRWDSSSTSEGAFLVCSQREAGEEWFSSITGKGSTALWDIVSVEGDVFDNVSLGWHVPPTCISPELIRMVFTDLSFTSWVCKWIWCHPNGSSDEAVEIWLGVLDSDTRRVFNDMNDCLFGRSWESFSEARGWGMDSMTPDDLLGEPSALKLCGAVCDLPWDCSLCVENAGTDILEV